MSVVGRNGADPTTGLEYSVIDFADGSGGPDSIVDSIAAWLNSPEMAHLLGLFDYTLEARTLAARIAEAEEISGRIFDFRRGGERWEARKAQFTEETTDALSALVDRIYREPTATPSTLLGAPTHALVLGGLLPSCLLRAEALSAVRRDDVAIGHVWALGSRRAATDTELDAAAALDVAPPRDELDSLTAAFEIELELGTSNRTPVGAPPSEIRDIAAGPPAVTGLAAKPGDPEQSRATTSDTYDFFREVAGDLSPDTPVLIVTSAIHGPFQHAQALAAITVPTGAPVRTVGAHKSTSRYDSLREHWTTAEWLQEIRSAIWSMRLLYDTLVEAHPAAAR